MFCYNVFVFPSLLTFHLINVGQIATTNIDFDKSYYLLRPTTSSYYETLYSALFKAQLNIYDGVPL